MQNQPTLFWDFDGTLAHRAGHQRGAMMYALDQHYPGHGITIDQLKPHLRNVLPWHMPDVPHLHLNTSALWWANIEAIFAGAFVKVGVPEDIAKTLAKITHEHYIDADGFVLFPNTIETLSSLRVKGWQNIILSNHVPELSDIVAKKGLSQYFSHIISSANVGVEKPNIKIFEHAIELAGTPSRAIMIGDNIIADIHGANNAGMQAILVHTEPDDSVEHFARTIADVEAILEQTS